MLSIKKDRLLQHQKSLEWAYASLIGYGIRCRSRPLLQSTAPTATTTVEPLSPNVLCSCKDDREGLPRAVLLAQRPDGGIAGVELCDGRQRYSTANVLGRLRSRRAKAVHNYLEKKHFSMLSETPVYVADALLLHSNHLVGYQLGTKTASLYAHTLQELSTLSTTSRKTLDPSRSLIGFPLCEWDSWREITREPGWEPYYASDEVLDAVLAGAINPQSIPQHAFEVDF